MPNSIPIDLAINTTCSKCGREMLRGSEAHWTPGTSLTHDRCPSGQTKTITLNFEVPSDLDTPSEVLAQMKQLMLGGLGQLLDGCQSMPADEERLCKALLVEF